VLEILLWRARIHRRRAYAWDTTGSAEWALLLVVRSERLLTDEGDARSRLNTGAAGMSV
jgi:hypothetical protein